jgi:hypothetical protein
MVTLLTEIKRKNLIVVRAFGVAAGDENRRLGDTIIISQAAAGSKFRAVRLVSRGASHPVEAVPAPVARRQELKLELAEA